MSPTLSATVSLIVQVPTRNDISYHFVFEFSAVDYCAAFCTPSVTQSSYLRTVGEKLLPRIDILWTGKII